MRTRFSTFAVALLLGASVFSFPAGVVRAGEQVDPPYLADALDPAVTTLAADLGISVDEARRRLGWQAPATQMADELRQAIGDSFGGLWFDVQNGGRVKVGLVAGATEEVQRETIAVISGWKLSSVTDLVSTETSYDQLERDSAWLGALTRGANDRASWELATAVRVTGNALELVLYVPRGATLNGAQGAAVASARERLGDRLRFDSWGGRIQREICTYWEALFICDPPLRGGLALFLNSGLFQCTTGFSARSLSDGKWYVMTAGHCGVNGTLFKARQPQTGLFHVVGRMHNSLDEIADDYGIVEIDNVSGWNPKPWVWVHEGPTTTTNYQYPIYGTSTSPIGTRVCLSGANSATETSCNEVYEVNWGGAGGLAVADYCSRGGDSGGPIFSLNRARGTHVGAEMFAAACTRRLFQGVREAAAALNVYVVTA